MQDIEKIRQLLFQLAVQEPYMGEEIPIRWIQFEHAMVEEAANNKSYATLDEVSHLRPFVCFTTSILTIYMYICCQKSVWQVWPVSSYIKCLTQKPKRLCWAKGASNPQHQNHEVLTIHDVLQETILLKSKFNPPETSLSKFELEVQKFVMSPMWVGTHAGSCVTHCIYSI